MGSKSPQIFCQLSPINILALFAPYRNWLITLLYVIVIARDRVQYEIYFPSSDIFVFLFSEPLGEENNNKISERGKYIHIVRVTCDNYFIISTKNI